MNIPRDILREMFRVMENNFDRIMENEVDEIINFSNPKWGLEVELPEGKYQLVLELKEVEK